MYMFREWALMLHDSAVALPLGLKVRPLHGNGCVSRIVLSSRRRLELQFQPIGTGLMNLEVITMYTT